MRIVAGLARGRKLTAPKGDHIRPTTDRAREALFAILGPLSGMVFCDLFSGSGAVGIEALSRGASRAVFVDCVSEAVAITRENVTRCGFLAHSLVWQETVASALERMEGVGETFDLVFADPPYKWGSLSSVLDLIAGRRLLKNEGKLIVQHAPYDVGRETESLALVDRRRYGRTVFSFYKTPSSGRNHEEHCCLPRIV